MSENEMLEEIKSLSPSEEAILTMLIRYQNLKAELEKEKEKNKKYLVNLTHEQYIKLVEQIRSEINKEWKDVIKAKIEYYEKIDNPVGKRVLQSLLEKEQ